MKIFDIFKILFVVLLLSACAGKETVKYPPISESKNQNLDTLKKAIIDSTEVDNIVETDTLIDENGSLISELLERVRKHYVAAIEAENSGDKEKCAAEFEYAIAILNEISYYPNIEKNQDFNDLSRSIIEDYEIYIANIDSLGAESSVFALREKLNQLLEAAESPEQYIPKEIIPGLSVPLVINGLVQLNIDYFLTKGRHHMERWLKRSGKYFPIMKKIFKEEGVPEELIYLSMIESGLNPYARSWAKAVGIWQFIKGTGKLYGLDGNWWYDDRRDVEKATRAAARHLKDLYDEFEDWHLAIAAYNSGAGRVKSAIRRSGTTVFWFLRNYLPKETRNYVPQYIAAAVIAMNPEKYGFDLTTADPPLEYDIVEINECVDLKIIAECAESDIETIRELNPNLIQSCTPPGVKGFELKIPQGKKEIFISNYAQVPNDKKRDWAVHTVRKGETLSTIAKKYGLPKSLIAEVNNINLKTKLKAGRSIIIPGILTPTVGLAQNQEKEVVKSKKSRKISVKDRVKITYKIKPGDTLSDIAERFGVRVSDIRNWNDISYKEKIKANSTIELYVRPGIASEYNLVEKAEKNYEKAKKSNINALNRSLWKVHKVQPKETLEKIAKKYRVTTQDIKYWNGLKSNTVYVGQELEIYVVAEQEVNSKITEERDKNKQNNKILIQHKVKKGETLYSIASLYKVTISDLKIWNNMKSNLLREGQLVVVYLNKEA